MKTLPIEEKERINSIIKQATVGYLGLIDSEGLPYVIPMNFGYDGVCFYLHSGQENNTLNLLRKNNQVCLTLSIRNKLMFRHQEIGCSYYMKAESIIVRGVVDFLEDLDEKRQALDTIMQHYTDYPVKYGDPAVQNVVVWRITPTLITAREYGAPRHKK